LKNKINIFSDKKVEYFLKELLCDYELSFMYLNEIEKNIDNISANIIIINNNETQKLIYFKKLTENFLVVSNLKNINLLTNNQIIQTPISINNIKTTIKNFIENLKIKFHDIAIVNEKLTNVNNQSFCYLTKLESEILSYIIIEKETTKKHIQENILNIKSTIQTNSLESHLTRIRKKMNQINTSVKIQSKSEKLSIII
tara:strand:- start:3265 stop:3861 length:597 start_codon:yes stop_codon:yes gene_type:complete